MPFLNFNFDNLTTHTGYKTLSSSLNTSLIKSILFIIILFQNVNISHNITSYLYHCYSLKRISSRSNTPNKIFIVHITTLLNPEYTEACTVEFCRVVILLQFHYTITYNTTSLVFIILLHYCNICWDIVCVSHTQTRRKCNRGNTKISHTIT